MEVAVRVQEVVGLRIEVGFQPFQAGGLDGTEAFEQTLRTSLPRAVPLHHRHSTRSRDEETIAAIGGADGRALVVEAKFECRDLQLAVGFGLVAGTEALER